MENIPRQLNQLLEQMLNGRILINHDIYDYKNRIKTVSQIVNRFVVSILFLSVMLTAALLSFNVAMQEISKFLFGLAAILLVWELVLMFKHK